MATTETAKAERVDEVLQTPERNAVLVDAPVKAEKPAKEKADDSPTEYVKTIDKMGNELGLLRKENRELMSRLDALQKGQDAANAPDPISFDEDPQAFVREAIKSALDEQLGPQLQVLQSDLLQRKSTAFDEKLSSIYPDWQETAKTDDFAEWIKASPARTQMYRIADANYDVDSAAELIKRFRQDQAEAKQSERGALNAAGLVAGGGDSGGAKVYAASEIKSMMQSDPDGYRRWLSSDGYKAYQDGRVDQNR